MSSGLIKLNVGGTWFITLEANLLKKIKKISPNEYCSSNLMEHILSIKPILYIEDNIFIDRSPTYFGYILNYLRCTDAINQFRIPEGIDLFQFREEAIFYNLEGLIELINCNSIVSNILDIYEAKNLYNLCQFTNRDTFKLIYAASKDGFAARKDDYAAVDFHRKCDNISKVLVIYKAINGFIFGGYTETSWDSFSAYKYDNKAFIFSLKNKFNKKIKINVTDPSSAIICDRMYGPSFGRSDINNHSSINNISIGNSYKHPTIDPRSINELFPDFGFKIAEIEIFKKI